MKTENGMNRQPPEERAKDLGRYAKARMKKTIKGRIGIKTRIILSTILATITLISLRAVVYILKTWQYSKIAKNSKARMEELEKLEKEGIIKTVVIDLQNEKYRVRNPSDFNGLIIDGEKYNDLTSWFIKKREGLYIIGKQENYIIKLLINKN